MMLGQDINSPNDTHYRNTEPLSSSKAIMKCVKFWIAAKYILKYIPGLLV